MTNDLLKTKLFIPQARSGLVARARLLQKLDEGLEQGKRLSLISAPPGFGKSTLIADWIQHCGNPSSEFRNPKSEIRNLRFCWLTLDESDSDPAGFWRYLIAALQTADPSLGEPVLSALQSPQAPSLTAVVSTLINELAGLEMRLVLVLDDYHLIDSTPIHESLNFFLDHMPPQIHPVIATRSDPPLQLARRRGRGELNEIRGVDLRFTSTEIAAFFNSSMKLGLSDADVAALENRTEGWIVGMQMAALSLQDTPDKHAMVETFSGEDRYIADYLVEEVLDHQPDAIQDFLLKTSVLDRLTASLCDAVVADRETGPESEPRFAVPQTPSSQSILETLERSNLFLIPMDNRRQWFRYHHLFAHLLRQKLELRAGKSTVCAYQRLAWQWYEQNQLIPEAIRLALACGDFEDAARMLEAYANQMFVLSEMATLMKWALSLPEPVLLAHPALLMSSAWATHATGHVREARKLLALVEKSVHASIKTHMLAEDRLAELPPLGRAALIEGSVLYMRIALDYESIEDTILLGERVLPYLVRERDREPFLFNIPSGLRSPTLFQLAVAARRKGNLEAARRGFEEAAVLAQEAVPNIHIIALAYGFLAQIQIEQGKLEEADVTCQKALYIIQGFPVLPTAFFGLIYVDLAQLAFERRDFKNVPGHLQKGLELGRLWNFWEGLIPGYLLLARLRQAQGDPAGAAAALQELADLGAEEAFVLKVVETARLELLPAPGSPEPGFSSEPFQPKTEIKVPKFFEDVPAVEALSQREIQVLQLVAQGASNAEIAQKLYVSVNTVKKHVTNIFGKLGATTRIQAIERARKSGYI